MPCCCVLNCSNRSEKGFRLFHLPKGNANEERRKLWVQNIGRRSLPNNPFVCEIHFTEDQFEQNRADGKVLLKWNAVPTSFTNNKLPLQVAENISRGIATTNINEEGEDAPEEDEFEEIIEAVTSKRHDLKRKLRRVHKGTFTVNDNVKGTTETVKQTQKNKAKKRRNKYRDTSSADHNTMTLGDEIHEDEEEKTELKERLKMAENKIIKYENSLLVYQNIVERLFNSDQIAYMMSEPVRGFKWSDETINNALILYESCGRIGYEELRKQNFPFPCIHTLEAVLNKTFQI